MSNETGAYQVLFLLPSDYKVSVEQPGFNTVERTVTMFKYSREPARKHWHRRGISPSEADFKTKPNFLPAAMAPSRSGIPNQTQFWRRAAPPGARHHAAAASRAHEFKPNPIPYAPARVPSKSAIQAKPNFPTDALRSAKRRPSAAVEQ